MRIDPSDFTPFGAPKVSCVPVTAREHIYFSKVVTSEAAQVTIPDLLGAQYEINTDLVGFESRTAEFRAKTLVNIIILAAKIAIEDPSGERIARAFPKEHQAKVRHMQPIRIAAWKIFPKKDQKQNRSNYVRAADEVVHRKIDVDDVLRLFADGKLALDELRTAYRLRNPKKRSKPKAADHGPEAADTAAADREPDAVAHDHRQVDDCVVCDLEADADAATGAVSDCEYEDIPPAAKLPAVYEPPPTIPQVTEPEAALNPETSADGELKLVVSAALRRKTPLKAERRYIAEFTLDRNGVGIITNLRPVVPRHVMRTVTVKPKQNRL